MQITRHTKYKDCFYFVKSEHIEEVKKLVTVDDLEGYETLLSLSLGDFIRLTKNNKDLIEKLFFSDKKDFTFWELCKRLKWLDVEIEKIKKIFDTMKVNHKDEEKKAAANVNFLPFELEIMAFTIEKLHLHSFKEAEEAKLSDVLVLKRRESANAKYERNLREIYNAKTK